MSELLVIAIVALIVFGPEKLPELANKVANFWRSWQQMSKDLSDQLSDGFRIDTSKPFNPPENKENKPEHEQRS